MAALTTEQTNFLYLLAYMYMQQSKYTQALQLFRILRLHTAENMQIALTLAFCLYKASRLEEATKVLNSLDTNKLSTRQKTAYYFISSKVLWDLKKVTESREMLHSYLKCRKLNS
jgi:thioredoxin-like negative regulator of GroEL